MISAQSAWYQGKNTVQLLLRSKSQAKIPNQSQDLNITCLQSKF